MEVEEGRGKGRREKAEGKGKTEGKGEDRGVILKMMLNRKS